MTEVFKVGDIVVRINNDFRELNVGDLAVVVRLDNDDNVFVTNDKIQEDFENQSKVLPGTYGVNPDNLRKVTKLERALK